MNQDTAAQDKQYEIIYVDCPERFDAFLEDMQGYDRIAVDTEADSLHHYFEKTCLIQISLGLRDYLIDPLASCLEMSRLMDSLVERSLIFHGADYDLRMLRRSFDFQPKKPVFDTMLAAQTLAYEHLGLAALVERHFQIVLAKEGQKSDWSRRPLAESLLEYAANDTRHLLRLAELLEAELEAVERLSWHQEMCERVVIAAQQPLVKNPDRMWRVKGSHGLSRKELAVLKSLWHWRDQQAQNRDLPSFKILSNQKICDIIRWVSKNSFEKLSEGPTLPRNFQGARLKSFLDTLEQALELSADQWPALKPPARNGDSARLPREDEKLTRKLIKARDQLAEGLKVPGQLIAPRATIVAVSRLRPKSMQEMVEKTPAHHWQSKLLYPDFQKIFAAH